MTTLEQHDEQFQSILDAVERLRREKYPHIDSSLVRDLLRQHSDSAATDTDLTRNNEQIVELYLKKGEENA
jgi:hypothetical protein